MIDKSCIVLATRNAHKIREIRSILRGIPTKLIGVEQFSNVPNVEETGSSYVENAMIKAVEYSRALGKLCLAEDSGIEVDALGGRPGIHSARYSGGGDVENNAKMLRELDGIPEERRACRYRAACVLAFGDNIIFATEGTCEGRVALEPRGKAGFGYDPIFFVPDRGKTMAELGARVKNRISHRRRALEAMKAKLLHFIR